MRRRRRRTSRPLPYTRRPPVIHHRVTLRRTAL
ncbi:hypothetical protein PRIPAC_81769 [Pristionchus pacificus]|uniref:Uncharacterized protein n=1 Tax=Pristionchus pacificus TaxID=54126 RepID=A0A2A6BY77_PRIPA|nr:hypothetical protein PRIPAC_81769 [Pristionchus pacificus]|eukprot:PDM70806.1 hypothetical protein PRIPAC_45010 [Pristionchus pacificus]